MGGTDRASRRGSSGNKNAMKRRGFMAETIALRKEIVARARNARVHATDAHASRLINWQLPVRPVPAEPRA